MAKRILVADDDPAIADVLQLMLEAEGYEVETTMDGADVAAVRPPLPDLILLDIRMSGHDGSEICRGLKAHAATRAVPVVLVSATKDMAAVAEACGADAFLAKPFEMDDVLVLAGRLTGDVEGV